jgi:RHS repeat-associated protein
VSSALGTLSYDAENRVASVASAGVQYAYDSRNKRVWRSILSGGNLAQQVYVYGVDGQKIGTYTFALGQYSETNTPEMTNSTALLAQFFGRKRIGVLDRLGSSKYNQSNNQAQSFYPYGEDRGTVEPNDELKFATYTRDAASGLDYADQRYYANNFGRFMSPDRRGGHGHSPQSLNRYAYVLGDPINLRDRSGLDPEKVDGGDDPCDPNDVTDCDDDDDGSDDGGSVTCPDGTSSFAGGCAYNWNITFSVTDTEITNPALLAAETVADMALSTTFGVDLSTFGFNPNVPLPSCFVGFVENAIGQLSPFPTDDLPSPKDLGDQISEMVSLGLKYGANVVAFKRPNYYQIMMYQMYGTWALAGKGGSCTR